MQKRFIISLLFIILLLLITAACGLGYMGIAPDEVLSIMLSGLGFASDQIDQTAQIVVMEVRLPRIICAVLVGGSLGVAGAVFQAVLLNPLADPYTLGVSSGAAFGAALSMVLTMLGIALPSAWLVPFLAFAGALLTLSAVFSLSSTDQGFGSNTLILSGVIVAAILSAAIGFLKYIADEQVSVIIFWLMGSLAGKNWLEVKLLLILAVPSLLLLQYMAREMNILSSGAKTAASLGIDVPKSRRIILTAATLLTAASVSIAGIIAFIGLIIPHLLRKIIGPDNVWLLPGSFLGGGILLLTADTITRAFLPHEAPIGILTSLIGGPFFCYIFIRSQKRSRI
ncbi:MAG: iron ABC transporter permease [Deltaproteobacteria bacterium]|nr:MAG: iron ABC transporter permease [Deltaproteobacteria bacterium]